MILKSSNWVNVQISNTLKIFKLSHFLPIVILSLFMLSSCGKEEGYGGLATISGKVYAYDVDKDGVEIANGYAGEIIVYIGTHESAEIIDRIRTKHDGSYKFNMLRKGEYEVWVYTNCKNCPNGQEPIIQKVKVNSKKSHVELDDFVIYI